MNAINGTETIAVRRLETLEQLSAAADRETLLALGLGPGEPLGAWASTDGSAVAIAIPAHYGEGIWWLAATGPAEPIPVLVDAARAEFGAKLAGVTLPRSVLQEPPMVSARGRWGADAGEDWDLMLCEEAPQRQDGESAVLTGIADAEVQAFLDRVNPHHSVRADHPSVEVWAGVRGGGTGPLLAVGALTRRPSGVGYLASIATDPAARGAGLGSAVTGFLTRRVFEAGEPECTLAHYHPNDAARRIYLRLGYRTLAQFHSTGFH